LRDSSELISGMMPFLKSNDAVLDLGCGPRDQASVFDYIKCRYIGMDFDAAQADILADAHAIPFADNTFNAVFSYAVLEHLYNPFLVFSELNRVLKPDGIFCGTVSQGEPFHNSFFHHTAWGVLTLANFGELEILRIWPSHDTIKALALMGRYPRPLRWMMGTIDVLNRRAPFLAPRKAFGWTERERRVDELHRAGSICFFMRKSRYRENATGLSVLVRGRLTRRVAGEPFLSCPPPGTPSTNGRRF